MTLEEQPFEEETPIKNGECSIAMSVFWGYPFFQPTSSASPTPCGNRSSISPSSVAPARPPKIKLQHFCANEIFQGGNLELSRKTLNTTTQEPITPPNSVST